jgi:metal-responsive CopG/Arc/MetJ family transcriptional regulator
MKKKRRSTKRAVPSRKLEVLFSPRLAEGLRAAAEKEETTRSAVVRQAVKKYLEENKYLETGGLDIYGRRS